jgi:CHAP domain
VTVGTARQAVELALSYVGYREGPANNENQFGRELDLAKIDLHPDGSYYPLGRGRVDWCASFVRDIWYQLGVPVPFGRYTYTVKNDVAWDKANGTWLTPDADIEPGDQVQFGYPQFPGGHTGFVTKVYADGTFDTVEGNLNNAVQTAHRDRISVAGFFRPAYSPEPITPIEPPTPPLEGEDDMSPRYFTRTFGTHNIFDTETGMEVTGEEFDRFTADGNEPNGRKVVLIVSKPAHRSIRSKCGRAFISGSDIVVPRDGEPLDDTMKAELRQAGVAI